MVLDITNIPLISNSINITQSYSSEESNNILARMKTIPTDCFFKTDKILVNQLRNIEPIELSKLLQQFFMEAVNDKSIQDPIQFLDRLADIIPLAKIQKAVHEDIEDALIEAKSMFEEAKLYLQQSEKNTPSISIKTRLTYVLDGIISVIETILTSFGIGDIFEPSESNIHADNKSQKIMLVLSYFTIITSMIPVLGVTISSLVIGGTFLTISVLSVIWPHVKPRTRYLPANAENWTRQVQQGEFSVKGRKKILDEIANIMKIDRHPLLIGPSRVGKTLTAKAFAEAIERGDYPELSGKVVFCLNAAELIGQKASFSGSSNKILNKISETMGNHRDDIILVIDGIHVACKDKAKLSDQMTFFLEEGGKFPHVIGIATELEYEEYIKGNESFALRFDRVNIKGMERDETLEILYDTIMKRSDRPLIKEGALEHIHHRSSQDTKLPQPAAAIRLLKQCINKTKPTQRTPLENKIAEVANQLLSLRSQAATVGSKRKEISIEIADLESQMEDLQEELHEEKKAIGDLFKTKELYDLVKNATYSSVLKISTIQDIILKKRNRKQLKLFLLLQQFLKPMLETHLEKTAKALGIDLFIDKELIDKVANLN